MGESVKREQHIVCPRCGSETKVSGLLVTCHHCNRTWLARELRKSAPKDAA
jgi:transposase-like protein